jgi:transcriptional regulator with XRE-family HTH domain
MEKEKKIIIANIKRHLAERGMSGEKLCLEMNLSKSNYYNFMAGKTKDIRLSVLVRIAKGLHVPLDSLIH